MQVQPLSNISTMGLTKTFNHIITIGGITRLWAGLPPTLLRDVPFSALYWGCYEGIKSKYAKYLGGPNSILSNFIAGAGGGVIAASITTPIDVIKTRRQMNAYSTNPPETIIKIFNNIIKDDGIFGLFKGIVPRTAKVAPACAIMITTYELCKSKLSTN